MRSFGTTTPFITPSSFSKALKVNNCGDHVCVSIAFLSPFMVAPEEVSTLISSNVMANRTLALYFSLRQYCPQTHS